MKNKASLKILLLSVALSVSTGVSAQWQFGIKSGMDITSTERSQAGRVDETYSSNPAWTAGLIARYNVNEWLALRSGLDVMDRSHRMDRNLNYLQPVHTVCHNTYLLLPVMGDFSFGGEKLRGHLYAGGFAGGWLSARREGTTFWMTDDHVYFSPFDETVEWTDNQQRFTAGALSGAGLSYWFSNRWEVLLDALYYYDLVSYQKSSPHFADPRYLSSLSLSVGVVCTF